ncbi:hypothetical protein ABT061_13900 [Streptosporangium sp. NPDC002544]|uniref:hypothetical protein n=1 Tax=Streptosporangium sp. NPDC002544 TaxID=3154538 RepID=UPI003331B829
MVNASPPPGSVSSPLEPIKDVQTTGLPSEGRHSTRYRTLKRFSALLPTALVAAFAMAVLSFYGVSVSDMAFFGVYVVLCLAFPGLLLIRALYSGDRTLAEEIALGLALGYAIEVITYIIARALGAPLFVLAWPIITYVTFLAVPRLRKHWASASLTRAPIWWSWSLALIVASLIVWSALTFFRYALTWPEIGGSNTDMPFHLALIGEVRHHVPPTDPMVVGEPLLYHWFVYAHFAAASWVTGVEPLVLLFRLAMLPMLAGLAVVLGMIGRRVTGSWAGALLTVGGTFFIVAPSLYLGPSVGVFTWKVQSWTSPSQTFGALIFAPIVLLLLDLLGHRRRSAGKWLLLGIFLVVVMGAKAIYLPLLTVGLVTVSVVETIRRRRPPWPTLAALGMTVACLLFAHFVLFGRAQQGMVVDPFALMRVTWRELTGLEETAEPASTAVLGTVLLYVLCWVITWCGILGLLSRPRLLMKPGVALMLGMGAASIGVLLLFGHCSMSQIYFLGGAYPYVMVVTAYGLIVIRRRARVSPRQITVAVAAGVLAASLIRILCGVKVPLDPGQVDTVLYRPYIVLLAVTALVAVALFLKGRRGIHLWAFMIFMIAAVGLPAAWGTRVLSLVGNDVENVDRQASRWVPVSEIPRGALTAARWLRTHSDPDDTVATNAHCRWGHESPCDSRHFWVAALTERRVLVEGWSYTTMNLSRWRLGQSFQNIPFWDAERIRSNDVAFQSPSQAAIQRLRERFGVRWLFVDESRLNSISRIEDFARLRFRSDDYAVYSISDGSSS